MLTVGASHPIAFDVKDASGALANAATVTASILMPDGTTTPITITNPPASTGQYRYTYVTTVAGHHEWSAVTTSPATSWGDSFNVRDYHSILSLAEAKNHLSGGSTAAWTADDDELRNFLAAVTEVVEAKAGPCVRRTVTQRIGDACGGTIVLTQYPVISVTSVTSVWAGGPSWTGSSLVLDGDAGTVTTQLGAVPFYYGPWDVVTVTGRPVVPERTLHAAKELLRHLWETQRGQLAAPILGGGETFTTSTGWAFSIPNRVLEMLADDMTPAI